MADLIDAGEIGDVIALINNDGDLILRTSRRRDIVLNRAELRELLDRIGPVADLVARSDTPISDMSPAIERSLAQAGCVRVTAPG